MKPSDYEFAVGDKVVTIYGDVGRVVGICKSSSCVKRSFDELTWKSDNKDEVEWITFLDAASDFDEYYQIGKYQFDHKFDKEFVRGMLVEKELEVARLKKQLEVIDVLEKEGKE